MRCLTSNLSENCFASGSIDGTIMLWAVPSLNPTRYLNTIDDYEGLDKMYPYSIQHMFALEQVKSNNKLTISYLCNGNI